MSLYDTWDRYSNSNASDNRTHRAAIARGQDLFNTKLIRIRGVKGINDDLSVDELPGTCTTCHNTPNSGNHSTPMRWISVFPMHRAAHRICLCIH